MNKKEQSYVEWLEINLRLAKALSWTQPVAPDIAKPENFREASIGFTFNPHTNTVSPATSESNRHYVGSHAIPRNGTASQQGIALYSTKLRALQALRHEVEKMVAARLAAIDKQIEHELALDASPNGTE
jgi:hypothetical protein